MSVVKGSGANHCLSSSGSVQALIVMRDTQGNDMPNRGVNLEVVKNERLVVTNAYTKAWEPSEKPFMTVILTFE